MLDSLNSPAPRTGKDEKRSAILEIAHAAFLADGFAATSMSSIAARVGGSKATLYNYFASKEELFIAVIRERCEELLHVLFDADFDQMVIETVLHRMGSHLVDFVLSESKLATHRLVTAETARFPELGRAFYESGPAEGRRRLAVFFEHRIAMGDLKAGDTMRMAEHFSDLCLSGLHQRALWNVNPRPSPGERKANVDHAVRVFLAAYGMPRSTVSRNAV
ncbi:MAG TPA: TetR/AcrR family transcriptional regulator [Rhizomicrobium sp.]|jgi:AcrR family transcriptional regulator